MARHKKHEEESHPAAGHGWMTSFADLLTLLLCFFVLLLTMRAMDNRKFEEAFGTFSGAFGVLGKSADIGGVLAHVDPMSPPVPQVITKDIEAVLENNLSDESEPQSNSGATTPPEPKAYRDQFETEVLLDGIETRIVSEVLFEGDSSKLTRKATAMLLEIGRDLATSSTDIRVESYLPVTSDDADEDAYWGLSLDRAAAVADVLAGAEGLDRARLSVMGYARPAPRLLRISKTAPTISILARTDFPKVVAPAKKMTVPSAAGVNGAAVEGGQPGENAVPNGLESPGTNDAGSPRAPAGTNDGAAPAGTNEGPAPAGTNDGPAPAGTNDGAAPAGTVPVPDAFDPERSLMMPVKKAKEN